MHSVSVFKELHSEAVIFRNRVIGVTKNAPVRLTSADLRFVETVKNSCEAVLEPKKSTYCCI
mgnify:CR=1 FL=1